MDSGTEASAEGPTGSLHLQRPQPEPHKAREEIQLGTTVEQEQRKTVKMRKTDGCGFWQEHKGFWSTCRSANAEQGQGPGTGEDKHPTGDASEAAKTAPCVCKKGKDKEQ